MFKRCKAVYDLCMALSFLMIALIALIAFFVHLLLSSLVKQQVFEKFEVTAQHYDELAAKQQMAESLMSRRNETVAISRRGVFLTAEVWRQPRIACISEDCKGPSLNEYELIH